MAVSVFIGMSIEQQKARNLALLHEVHLEQTVSHGVNEKNC